MGRLATVGAFRNMSKVRSANDLHSIFALNLTNLQAFAQIGEMDAKHTKLKTF
jgi:hypothetical protein